MPQSAGVVLIPHPPPELTVRNLAIAIFSCSLEPLTSASAVSLMAGGPVGISIMQNQSIGSEPRKFVLDATIQMSGMLIL